MNDGEIRCIKCQKPVDYSINGICETCIANNTKLRDELINEVMRGFNFGRLHDAMLHVGWAWSSAGNNVPTEDQLKEKARALLTEAWTKQATIRTGGFSASFIPADGDETGELQLLFIFERGYADLPAELA